jgi:hypothetical protein
MPAAIICSSTLGSLEAGPMVATIFVERMGTPPTYPATKRPLLANEWPFVRLTLGPREALIGAGLIRLGPVRSVE